MQQPFSFWIYCAYFIITHKAYFNWALSLWIASLLSYCYNNLEKSRKSKCASSCAVVTSLARFSGVLSLLRAVWSQKGSCALWATMGMSFWNHNPKPEVCKLSDLVSKLHLEQLTYSYPVIPGRIRNEIHTCQRSIKCCQVPQKNKQGFILISLKKNFIQDFFHVGGFKVNFQLTHFKSRVVFPSCLYFTLYFTQNSQ